MPLLARIAFAWLEWKFRRGLRDPESHPIGESALSAPPQTQRRLAARRTGIRGETYAYWYLRRHGYIFIARNVSPAREKGELDLVGYDGETLAFVEVRTRTLAPGKTALPELSITREKHEVLSRTAWAFLRERHVKPCPIRFDVVAIDERPGQPPEVRLRKDALSRSA